MAAFVAVEDPLVAGKPFSALPDMSFSCDRADYCGPPVIENKEYQADYPLDNDQREIPYAKQDGEQASVFAALVGQLHFCAAALGTFSVYCH